MKKTLFVGLLAAAIMAISFTGCKNNPDLGTAPTITGAFMMTSEDYDDKSIYLWDDALTHAQTDLSLSGDYRLAIKMEDPDKDIVEVVISKQITFDNWWHWTDLKYTSEAFWTGLRINFSTMTASDKNDFKMNNGTFYVKIIDAKGNKSNIYPVSGITVQ
jgi:hypothetical protein